VEVRIIDSYVCYKVKKITPGNKEFLGKKLLPLTHNFISKGSGWE